MFSPKNPLPSRGPQADLIAAAQAGDSEACQRAMDAGADPLLAGLYGRTPLGMAAAAGRAACCEILSRGIRGPHPICGQGLSPLAWAARGGWSDCVEILLKRAHPLDLDPINMRARDIPWTPLVAALLGGHEQCAELLLPHSRVRGDFECCPPLIAAFHLKDPLPMLEKLLSLGANARASHQNKTALFAAIEAESMQALRLLLPLSCPRESGPCGRRALEVAARQGWEEGAFEIARALPHSAPPTHFKRAAQEARYGGHPALAHALDCMLISRRDERFVRQACAKPAHASARKARL